jgi:uncharacterized protein YjbI with pentapeptide repeats
MHPAWFSGGTRHQSLYHECHENSDFSYAASRAFPAKGSFYEGGLIGIASLRVVGQADITFVNWETAPVHTHRAEFWQSFACRRESPRGVLIGADLSHANLGNANLRETSFQGADLSFADLRGAFLSRSGLSGAQLKETIMPDGTVVSSN